MIRTLLSSVLVLEVEGRWPWQPELMELIVEVRQAEIRTGEEILAFNSVEFVVEVGQAELWILRQVHGIATSSGARCSPGQQKR